MISYCAGYGRQTSLWNKVALKNKSDSVAISENRHERKDVVAVVLNMPLSFSPLSVLSVAVIPIQIFFRDLRLTLSLRHIHHSLQKRRRLDLALNTAR